MLTRCDARGIIKEKALGVVRMGMDVLSRLTAMQREVLTRRYGLDGREPASTEQVAAELGKPLEIVRRIELVALVRCQELTTGQRRHERSAGLLNNPEYQ